MTDPTATEDNAARTKQLTSQGAESASDTTRRGVFQRWRNSYVLAALFVAPYTILMLSWAMSNPPGAAPDEAAHLVKAIGVARLQIGAPYSVPVPSTASPLARRNASISRVVRVPQRLVPDGYSCTAFKQNLPATCLPNKHSTGTKTVPVITPMGAYPPFLYLPIGLAARAMDSPTRAIMAGRLVCVAMATLLLLFGAAHLIRWLGRQALLGAFIGLTPMVLFASAMVSTSGVETCGAFAVASVGVVAILRKESLFAPATMFTLAGCGAALILSRQLGSVTFGGVVLLMIARVGWRTVWELVRRHQPAFVSTMVILLAALTAIYWWEHGHDHPTDTGPIFDGGAFLGFRQNSFKYVDEGVGMFGWLDTVVPKWVVLAWVLLAVVVVGMAILLGRTPDRWSLVTWLVTLVLIAYVAYATVFYPIGANLQARHILPFFMFCPLFAGTVFIGSLDRIARDVVRRVFYLTAAVMPVIQITALYVNARRYAVGINGPMVFLGHSRWSPKFGWGPWLSLGLTGAAALALVIVRFSSGPRAVIEETVQNVER
jgi:hypothetical protein